MTTRWSVFDTVSPALSCGRSPQQKEEFPAALLSAHDFRYHQDKLPQPVFHNCLRDLDEHTFASVTMHWSE